MHFPAFLHTYKTNFCRFTVVIALSHHFLKHKMDTFRRVLPCIGKNFFPLPHPPLLRKSGYTAQQLPSTLHLQAYRLDDLPPISAQYQVCLEFVFAKI